MWKVYRSSPMFDRDLRTHLKLPDQEKGSLSAWFEKTVPITRSRTARKIRRRTGFIQCSDFGLCIKEYVVPRYFGSRLLNHISPLRRHNKLVIYKYHRRIFDLGIPVPELYACLYECNNQKHSAFTYIFISRKLEGAEAMRKFIYRSQRAPEEKQQVFSRLGHIVANMHKVGCLHNDLGYGNIMVNEREVFLIDLDASVCLPLPLPLPRRVAIRDLIIFIGDASGKDYGTYRDTYIAVSSFFAEYCKVLGEEPSRLLEDIRHRLDVLKSRRDKKSGKKKRESINFTRAYKLVEIAAEFCDSTSAK